MIPRILMIGSFGHPTGYSRAFMDYCHALQAVNAEFQIHPLIPFEPRDLSPRDEPLLAFIRPPQHYSHVDVAVVHTIPQFADVVLKDDYILPRKPDKTALITTWEFSALPAWVPEKLQAFNRVIVPSTFNVGIFDRAGVATRLVPHAFDPKWWWAPEAEALAKQRDGGVFTFYNVGTWCERKNPIGLLKAYLTAFTADDPVRLVLVHGHNPEMVDADIRDLKQALGLSNYPEVFSVSSLTDPAIRALHWSSNCFVTAARSEGFGLGAFEAMLTGASVFAPSYGGHVDFLAHTRGLPGLLYPAQETPVVDPLLDPNLGVHGRMCWGEPGLGSLQAQMRIAAGYRPSVQREQLLKHYGLEAVGNQLLEVLS